MELVMSKLRQRRQAKNDTLCIKIPFLFQKFKSCLTAIDESFRIIDDDDAQLLSKKPLIKNKITSFR